MVCYDRVNEGCFMSYEKALEAFKQLYEKMDRDNWLFVHINPEMVKIAIDSIERTIKLGLEF